MALLLGMNWRDGCGRVTMWVGGSSLLAMANEVFEVLYCGHG